MNQKKKKTAPGELPYRSCVGIMVLNRENLVWTGHRIAPDNGELSMTDKRWQMPQGGIDKDEDALDAAKRELWEETGIKSISLLAASETLIRYDLPGELVGTALKGKYRGQEMAWFAFRFEGDESEINIAHPPEGTPVEFDAWKWLPMQALPGLIVPFKRKLYEEVVATFQHLV